MSGRLESEHSEKRQKPRKTRNFTESRTLQKVSAPYFPKSISASSSAISAPPRFASSKQNPGSKTRAIKDAEQRSALHILQSKIQISLSVSLRVLPVSAFRFTMNAPPASETLTSFQLSRLRIHPLPISACKTFPTH